jgi:hypothetical protein
MVCEQFLVGKGGGCGHLFQMPCPAEFVGEKFEVLFNDFVVNRRMMPIALYRGPTDENEALQYYVYAVPRRSAELHETDRIFVFGSAAQLQKEGRVEFDAIETRNSSVTTRETNAASSRDIQQQRVDPTSPAKSGGGNPPAARVPVPFNASSMFTEHNNAGKKRPVAGKKRPVSLPVPGIPVGAASMFTEHSNHQETRMGTM